MKTKSIGFIGGGRITKIFLKAFKNKSVKFQSIVVIDLNKETLKALKKQFPEIEIANFLETVAKQDMVMLAVHPPVMMEVLEKIAPFVSENTVLLSLAPKIKTGSISGKVTNVKNIARLIPNATSVINEGYNPVCFSNSFSADKKNETLELLKILGHTFEVAENKLEAYAIVSAMAPTYFWFQWKKLVDIGKEIGLENNEANQTVYQTMIAALNTQFKSGLSNKKVLDLIPVKPIGENEKEIENVFDQKLKGLYSKLTS